MKPQLLIIMLAALLLSGCSSTSLFVLNNSLKLGSENTANTDISFGQQIWQKLDVYTPTDKTGTKKPVLVFFYGGSWDSGNKEMYYFVANSFTKLGYVVVIPDYAKYPDARFPVFIEDGAAAINWVLENIEEYQGDKSKIVVAGHSAGAHLGALLLSDPQYLAKHNREAQDIRAFAGLAGPYNFTPTSAKLLDVFGPIENLPNMRVNTHVSGEEPRMLLLHGEADSTVGMQNQISLHGKLEEVGVPVSSKVYPKVGHVKILMTLTSPLKGGASTLDDMDSYFKSVLGEETASRN